ncbi:hypothetical protein D048_3268 [Vibrio parahaemolyticus VPTS-2009]|nr:hypothetical protein D048_3268 [Vibrio parahaemolyticus VPTS-2009]
MGSWEVSSVFDAAIIAITKPVNNKNKTTVHLFRELDLSACFLGQIF